MINFYLGEVQAIEKEFVMKDSAYHATETPNKISLTWCIEYFISYAKSKGLKFPRITYYRIQKDGKELLI